MKKLLSLALLAVGLFVVSRNAEAGSLPRTPKEVFVSTYTTGAVFIPPAISTSATGNAAYSPGAIYEVVLATGASAEFVLFVDTTSCVGVTAGMAPTALGNGATLALPRLYYGSTTAGTDYKFDPPVEFHNGLCAVGSAATGQFGVIYELGRGLSGN